VINMNEDATYNYLHPLSFAATKEGNETFYYHQAKQLDDWPLFVKAMVKELHDHTIRRHWKLVPRSTIGNAKTIKAIWSFKRKRRPDGSLLKHKARLCAHGGMQIHGETYWDTYSPVVNWISIRVMLILSVIHGLHSRSIDFTLAFPHAESDVPIYMELPLGCDTGEDSGDYVFLLLRNLYGLKQGNKTWFELLKERLTSSESDDGFEFRQSKVDPCVFHKPGITLISFVDDCLIFSKDKETADKFLEQLKEQFMMTDEGDVHNYLGVEMNIDAETDSIKMVQPYLIQRIIEDLGASVKDCNIKSTPAVAKEILHKDENGPERKQSWNYRSVIGK
jgi:hypothetical protein